MTVDELIAYLQKFPGDLQVRISDDSSSAPIDEDLIEYDPDAGTLQL